MKLLMSYLVSSIDFDWGTLAICHHYSQLTWLKHSIIRTSWIWSITILFIIKPHITRSIRYKGQQIQSCSSLISYNQSTKLDFVNFETHWIYQISNLIHIFWSKDSNHSILRFCKLGHLHPWASWSFHNFQNPWRHLEAHRHLMSNHLLLVDNLLHFLIIKDWYYNSKC